MDEIHLINLYFRMWWDKMVAEILQCNKDMVVLQMVDTLVVVILVVVLLAVVLLVVVILEAVLLAVLLVGMDLAASTTHMAVILAFRMVFLVVLLAGDLWGPGGGFPGQMPWWMMAAQQESVRPVELPTFAELTETEVGPLVAGDWLVTITPFMRDISSSSSAWWDQVMRTAEHAYRRWLDADPMARLRMTLTVPDSFQRAPWLRVEQRGSVALLKAIPETIRSELIAQREVGSIHIIFKVLRVYQPGGLGERTALLKQLVDQKVPTVMSEWLLALRSWRRWLTRVGELKIQTPDPVLLLATLDKFAAELSKQSQQISFRLQVARATLRVDVNPTEVGVYQFAETLLAEGESAVHAVGKTKEVDQGH